MIVQQNMRGASDPDTKRLLKNRGCVTKREFFNWAFRYAAFACFSK